ncbi:hypothetical protein ES703_113817 [subsurface metagenome]
MFALMQHILRGIILQWHGSIASIPGGWALCDGENDTPDLRDCFIIAAKEDDAGVAKTNITGSLTKIGGNKDHTHAFNDGGHTHPIVKTASREDGAGICNSADFTQSGTASGTTGNPNTIPVPYYALAYIMKL